MQNEIDAALVQALGGFLAPITKPEPTEQFTSMCKPIMSRAVEKDVENALSQFKNRHLWNKWGMNVLRPQGTAILLEGPPGTGKTTIARYMAKRRKQGFKQLDMSQLVGDGSPGSTEKAIDEFFDDAMKRHNMTIFMDECEAILIDRTSIGDAGLTWQLGSVNKTMTRMNTYPGLIIAATNHPDMVDKALSDRFLAIIKIGRPDADCRRRLWIQKLPKSFPFRTTPDILRKLAQYDLSGRQIESVILNCASNAIRLGKAPTVSMMVDYCQVELKKKL